MPAPLDRTVGDLVILKGGIVGRTLDLQVTGRCLRAWEDGDQRKGRVLAQNLVPDRGMAAGAVRPCPRQRNNPAARAAPPLVTRG